MPGYRHDTGRSIRIPCALLPLSVHGIAPRTTLTNTSERSWQDYSNWPTIPQLYIDGEFTGGSDIMIEAFQSGELKQALEEAGATFTTNSQQ